MADGIQQTTPPGLDPSQISPQALATLFPGAQAPTTPPIAPSPGAGGMEDYARLAAEQQKQLLSSGPAQEAERARAAGPGFAAQISQTPLPNMGPHIEKGGGFLHNLGQALQMVSMVTPAGREMFGPGGPVYGPGIAKYRATQAGLMGQKEASEKEAEESGKEVQALAGVAGRTIYGGSRVEAEQIGAAQRAQAVISSRANALDRIAAMTNMNDKRVAAQVEIANLHADIQEEIAKMGNVTKEEVARIMASSAQTLLNTKIAEDPSVMGTIKRLFGVSGAQAPGGAQPVSGAAPLPSRNAKPTTKPNKPATKAGPPAGATHIGTSNKDHKDHYLDAQGKDLGPVG